MGLPASDVFGVCPFVSGPGLLVLSVLSLPADFSAFVACSVNECEGRLDSYLSCSKGCPASFPKGVHLVESGAMARFEGCLVAILRRVRFSAHVRVCSPGQNREGGFSMTPCQEDSECAHCGNPGGNGDLSLKKTFGSKTASRLFIGGSSVISWVCGCWVCARIYFCSSSL